MYASFFPFLPLLTFPLSLMSFWAFLSTLSAARRSVYVARTRGAHYYWTHSSPNHTCAHPGTHTLSCQEAHFLKSHCWQGILLLQIQYCMCIVCVYILHNTHQHSVPLALGTKSTAHSRIAVPSFCQHTHSHTPFPPASFPVGTWCRWWQIQPG